MCRICGNRKTRKERTCVKREEERAENGLEEMVGQAKRQSKMEEIMLVALGGLAFLCCEVFFCVVVFCCFFPSPPAPKADHTAVVSLFLNF